MKILAGDLTRFLNKQFYYIVGQPEFPGVINVNWLPDEFSYLRAVSLIKMGYGEYLEFNEASTEGLLLEQIQNLCEQFSFFIKYKVTDRGDLLIVDRYSDFNLEESEASSQVSEDERELEAYYRDRARFIRWAVEIQRQDFSQIKVDGTSLEEYALLPQLEKCLREFNVSSRASIILVDLDHEWFSTPSLAALRRIVQSTNATNEFVLFVTAEKQLVLEGVNIISLPHGLLNFNDLAVQLAGMTEKPVYRWSLTRANLDASFTCQSVQKRVVSSVEGSQVEVPRHDFFSQPFSHITLVNKQGYLERLCDYMMCLQTNTSVLSEFIRSNPSVFFAQSARVLSGWARVYSAITFTLSNGVEEDFGQYSVQAQLIHLREALLKFAMRSPIVSLVVFDFDGTITNAETKKINGGSLGYWAQFIARCIKEYGAFPIFMTSRPQFARQADVITEVKISMTRGELGFMGACFLHGIDSKANMINWMLQSCREAQVQRGQDPLTVNVILLDDTDFEIKAAQACGLTAVKSCNIEPVASYEEFLEIPFIDELLNRLAPGLHNLCDAIESIESSGGSVVSTSRI